MLHFICLSMFCMMTRLPLIAGQVNTITTPEGIYSYPKVLSKLEISSATKISCFIDSVRFVQPDGVRTALKPKLFAVEEAKTSSHSRIRKFVETTPIYEDHSGGTAINENSSTPKSSTKQHAASFEATSTHPSTTPVSYTVTTAINSSDTSTFETTAGYSTTLHTPTTTSGNSTVPPHGYDFQLVQLYDLDREVADKHFVTVHCRDANGTFASYLGDLFLIQVQDINDNTPVFNETSLRSTVSRNVTEGDAVLLLKATDADIGINAQLQFGMVRGTVRLQYKNETKRGKPVLVLESGYVLIMQQFERDVTITFKVTVKDHGDYADGNRATATATINVLEDFPTPNPPAASSELVWWWIALPCIGVILLVIVLALVNLKCRKRRHAGGQLLIIDDESFIENDDPSDMPVQRDFPDSRTESLLPFFRRNNVSDNSDDDSLVT